MKKITKLIAAVLLVAVAAVGAYASAQKSQVLLDVFYINADDECVEVKANTICEISTEEACIEPLLDPVTAAPLGISRQIYDERNPTTGECEQPYERP